LGEIAGDAIEHRAGFHVDDGLLARGDLMTRQIGQQRRHRKRTGEPCGASERNLEFEGDKHGCLATEGGGGGVCRPLM
jgi:hypothetical protein